MGDPKKAPPGAPTSAPADEAPPADGFDLGIFLEQDASHGASKAGIASPSLETEIDDANGLLPMESAPQDSWGEQISNVSTSQVGWAAAEPVSAEPSASKSAEVGLEAPEATASVVGLDLGDLDLGSAIEPSVSIVADENAAVAVEDFGLGPAPDAGTRVYNDPAPELGTPGEGLAEVAEGAGEVAGEMLDLADLNGGGLESATVDGLGNAGAVNVEQASVSGDWLAAPAREEALLPASGASAISTADIETLRKYAVLKEREGHEREASNRALQSQIEQIRAKLDRSDAERRRLTLALQESETARRSSEDARDQGQHRINKMEAHHQEELRALQLRLDNAQFQASKAEKKLDDFRERVRADIQKIRLRERELANRLELQKRDAEALLTVKDEKLLQQKREIDRLEYELELLKERMVDETERAEERMGRLSRALRAMKLAEGLLSEIDEEVLPGAGSGEGEAA